MRKMLVFWLVAGLLIALVPGMAGAMDPVYTGSADPFLLPAGDFKYFLDMQSHGLSTVADSLWLGMNAGGQTLGWTGSLASYSMEITPFGFIGRARSPLMGGGTGSLYSTTDLTGPGLTRLTYAEMVEPYGVSHFDEKFMMPVSNFDKFLMHYTLMPQPLCGIETSCTRQIEETAVWRSDVSNWNDLTLKQSLNDLNNFNKASTLSSLDSWKSFNDLSTWNNLNNPGSLNSWNSWNNLNNFNSWSSWNNLNNFNSWNSWNNLNNFNSWNSWNSMNNLYRMPSYGYGSYGYPRI